MTTAHKQTHSKEGVERQQNSAQALPHPHEQRAFREKMAPFLDLLSIRAIGLKAGRLQMVRNFIDRNIPITDEKVWKDMKTAIKEEVEKMKAFTQLWDKEISKLK